MKLYQAAQWVSILTHPIWIQIAMINLFAYDWQTKVIVWLIAGALPILCYFLCLKGIALQWCTLFEGRIIVIAVNLICLFVAMQWLNNPSSQLLPLRYLLITQGVVLMVNLWYLSSLHLSGWGFLFSLAYLLNPSLPLWNMLLWFASFFLIGWARWYLSAHTILQLFIGLLCGAIPPWLLYGLEKL